MQELVQSRIRRRSLGWSVLRWSVGMLAVMCAMGAVIPLTLVWLRVGWYVAPAGGMDNIDSYQLAFALTELLVWLAGVVCLLAVEIVERLRRKRG